MRPGISDTGADCIDGSVPFVTADSNLDSAVSQICTIEGVIACQVTVTTVICNAKRLFIRLPLRFWTTFLSVVCWLSSIVIS